MQSRSTRIDDALSSMGEGLIELGWLEHGDPDAPQTILCIHGLTRNAHDFDMLAERLARRARVIAVDMVGRGRSSWLDDPRGYAVPNYACDILTLLDTLGIDEVDWIGTSMGGLIGMAVAGMEDRGVARRVRRLVLNDVGPFVPKNALSAIADYLGFDLRFATLEELEAHLRAIHAGFGPLTDDQWRHLALHGGRRDGTQWRLHYDPAIRIPFAESAAEDVDSWPFYDRVTCPTLVLRGARSPLLGAATAEEMSRRGPKAKILTFDGIGHAPALMAADQIEAVSRYLAG